MIRNVDQYPEKDASRPSVYQSLKRVIPAAWVGWIASLKKYDRRKYYQRLLILSVLCVVLLVLIGFIEQSPALHDLGHPYLHQALYLTIILMAASLVLQILTFHFLQWKSLEIAELNYRNSLSLKLAITKDRNEMVSQLLQYSRGIVPMSSESLLLYNRGSKNFDPIALWGLQDSKITRSILTNTPEVCSTCARLHAGHIYSLDGCNAFNQGTWSGQLRGYCLPVAYESSPVALLRFGIDPEVRLTVDQVSALNNIAPVVSATLEGARLHQERLDAALNQAAREERHSLARDLHDTLVQDLCYLRLKLEQLAGDVRSARTEDVLGDLLQMQEVVNADYESVRGTLASLYTESTAMLEKMFSDHAELVSSRTALEFKFSSQGQLAALDPETIRQIFYVFREAVQNIEKHAHATKVNIRTIWGEKGLWLYIADNGTGYDQSLIQSGSHFGISIMRERVAALHGKITFRSSKGGTRVIICIPYPQFREKIESEHEPFALNQKYD